MRYGRVGERATFAIDYRASDEQTKTPYGNCTIWIEDNALADQDNEVFLLSVYSTLEALTETWEKIPRVPDVIPESADQLLQLAEVSDNHFLPVEGFDDWVKLVFRNAGQFIFLWSVHPKMRSQPGFQSYSFEVIRAGVSVDTFGHVVGEFGGVVRALALL
jgi:hypothetical protein